MEKPVGRDGKQEVIRNVWKSWSRFFLSSYSRLFNERQDDLVLKLLTDKLSIKKGPIICLGSTVELRCSSPSILSRNPGIPRITKHLRIVAILPFPRVHLQSFPITGLSPESTTVGRSAQVFTAFDPRCEARTSYLYVPLASPWLLGSKESQGIK